MKNRITMLWKKQEIIYLLKTWSPLYLLVGDVQPLWTIWLSNWIISPSSCKKQNLKDHRVDLFLYFPPCAVYIYISHTFLSIHTPLWCTLYFLPHPHGVKLLHRSKTIRKSHISVHRAIPMESISATRIETQLSNHERIDHLWNIRNSRVEWVSKERPSIHRGWMLLVQ